MLTCISNPPYNMKWNVPIFAQAQERFSRCSVPPENNANYAFILTGLEKADKATFILPCGILTTTNKSEAEIRKYLVDNNLIECIITCPDHMFESTSIPVCIVVLNKNKDSEFVEMIDMRNTFEIQKRKQNGQFGGSSHTGRTYVKELKVFTDEQMNKAIECISVKKDIPKFSKGVSAEAIRNNDYILTPAKYLDTVDEGIKHRPYDDIINDLNRIIRDKNVVKFTINESLARKLGLKEIYDSLKQSNKNTEEMNKLYTLFTDIKILKTDYIALSKNKNEIKIENKDKDKISEMIILILNMWKQHIMYLNNEENRYLVELRDALLPDLMSGKFELLKESEE